MQSCRKTPKGVIEMEAFVGVTEVAAFLGVKVSWIYEMVRLNKLPSYKIGPFRRFRLNEIDTWAREHLAVATTEKE
jgi:excisionase family DNA binding protein